ncbi:TonB-dependent receptor [Treponema sp.]|uniref:TonB-dependent receptor n=1 Tax=Treponema sp. TaxID=166 RepID=UPI003F02FFFE
MRKFFLFFLFSLNFCFAQDLELPGIRTSIRRTQNSGGIFLDEKRLSDFSSAEQALEAVGFSFKKGNCELTFHGYWNSSIKVYINNVLMNDPNTGKFDFSTLDFKSIKSIKIDPASVYGSVSIYISTVSLDYSAFSVNAEIRSKSYADSLNDSPGASAEISFPLLLENGSALFFQDSFTAAEQKNHFGYRSKEAVYKPEFKDSYSGYNKKYSGYERILFNNSFFAEYSSQSFPGASFGFASYASFSDANCGKTGGYYFSEENQKDASVSFALPVFLPYENFSLKILPSYKHTSLEYSKKARFSSAEETCRLDSFSFQAESSALGFVNLYALASYDVSAEKNASAQAQRASHNLFTAFFSPGVNFSFCDWDFSVAVPLNYFEPASSVDVLFSFSAEKTGESSAVFFKAARNITNPVFQQLYYSGSGGKGNPDLKCETAWSFYTGASYFSSVEASVKPFLIFYQDKIGWKSDSSGVWTCENWGSSVNWGADFSVSTKNLLEPFVLCAGYTFCRAILTSGGNTDGNQIMLTPVHSASVSASWSFWKGFMLRTVFSYNSRKYLDNSNSLYIPDYYNLDASLSWSAEKIRLNVLWQNVFDFQYVHVDGYPSPGTSVELSAGFRL